MNVTVTNITLSHSASACCFSSEKPATAPVVGQCYGMDMPHGCMASITMITDWAAKVSNIHTYCVRSTEPIIT